MRSLKMVGAGAVAAVAGAALLFGSGSEGASIQKTVLCKTQVETAECAEESIYPAEVGISAQQQEETKPAFKISTMFGPLIVECKSSQVFGETKAEKGDLKTGQLEAHIEVLQFAGCITVLGAKCAVEAVQLPWQALFSQDKKTQGSGSLELFEQEPEAGQPGVYIFCPAKVNCVYKVNEEGQVAVEVGKLAVEGGEPGKAVASQVSLKQDPSPVEPICPGPAAWDAEYTIHEPEPVYVEHFFQEE